MSKLTLKALPISAVLAAVCSLPAFAGSAYVENDYSIRNVFNGHSSTKVKVDDTYKYWREAKSTATKKGWSSTHVEQYSGSDKKGEWTDSSLIEKDKFDVSTHTTTWEKGDGITKQTVNVTDVYDYNGTDKTHRTTTGFSY